MPIAFVTSQTFAVSLAVDVAAEAEEAKRPSFRFRYLSEAQRMGFSEALAMAKGAERRAEIRRILFPRYAALVEAQLELEDVKALPAEEEGREPRLAAVLQRLEVAKGKLLEPAGADEAPSLERYFVRVENMPTGYRSWDDCTCSEWMELGDLVLAKQDLSEVDLKKARLPGRSSPAGSAQAVAGPAAGGASLPVRAEAKTGLPSQDASGAGGAAG